MAVITARKRSLGNRYIFAPYCHSVHRGEYLTPGTPRTRYTPQEQTPPRPGTPWDQVPPPPRPGTPPWDQVHPPQDQVHPPGPGTLL